MLVDGEGDGGLDMSPSCGKSDLPRVGHVLEATAPCIEPMHADGVQRTLRRYTHFVMK